MGKDKEFNSDDKAIRHLAADERQNKARTGAPIGTGLTQPCSPDVHGYTELRATLTKFRSKYGADTPMGHRCSNLLEQIEKWRGEAPHHQIKLAILIEQQLVDIERLKA